MEATCDAEPRGIQIDDEARENGGVAPTHGRTMNQQKAWFLQRAAAHRAAALAKVAVPAPAPTIEPDPRHVPPPTGATPSVEAPASSIPVPEIFAGKLDSADSVIKHEASEAVPPPPSANATAALDVTDAPEPADGLTERLRDLTLAGGDLATLGALAVGESRTDLTTALKALGFKGLRTRQELEAELKTWHAAQ